MSAATTRERSIIHLAANQKDVDIGRLDQKDAGIKGNLRAEKGLESQNPPEEGFRARSRGGLCDWGEKVVERKHTL